MTVCTGILFAFTGLQAQSPYCDPSGLDCSETEIAGVGLTSSISRYIYSTSCHSNGYQDHTSTVFDAEIGRNYTVSVLPNDNMPGMGFAVWIDWDSTGTFERRHLLGYTDDSASTGPYEMEIKIPENAVTEYVRMRIVGLEYQFPGDSIANPDGPCVNNGKGIAKDYSINIVEPPEVDIGVSSIESPGGSICPDSNKALDVVLENFGSDTQSNFTVYGSVDRGDTVFTFSKTYTDTLLFDERAVFNLGHFLVIPGSDLQVEAWTSLPGDEDTLNDESVKSVSVDDLYLITETVNDTACSAYEPVTMEAYSNAGYVFWYTDRETEDFLTHGNTLTTDWSDSNITLYVEARRFPRGCSNEPRIPVHAVIDHSGPVVLEEGPVFEGLWQEGDLHSPDLVCPGQSVQYTVRPPEPYENNTYDSLWTVSGYSIKDTENRKADNVNFHVPTDTESGYIEWKPENEATYTTYRLKLIVTNKISGCHDTVTRNIQLTGSPVITTSPVTVCADVELKGNELITNASGNISEWYFVSGTGDVVSFESPENFAYSFPDTGKHEVLLTAANETGCSDSVTEYVTVLPLPESDFNYVINADTTVQLTPENPSMETYAWKTSAGHVSTEPEPLFGFNTLNEYEIVLTVIDSNGCSYSTKHQVNLSSLTYMNQFYDSVDIVIYPNPAKTFINIDAKGEEINNITITDPAGRIVRQEKPERVRYQLIRGDIEAGVYILQAELHDGSLFSGRVVFR